MLIADFNAGDSLERGFTTLVAWLPHLLGALAVLVIGYLVAKAVGKLVRRATQRAGFDRMVQTGPAGNYVQRVVSSPSGLLGTVAYWGIWLAAIALAVSVLGVDALKDFVAACVAYLPNVLAALLIFLVAGAVAGLVATMSKRFLGDTSLGKVVSTAAPILVMTVATFMILDQLQIAENIVTITYAALIGAIALGSALAFGLGGRDVAREMLQGAYAKGQENKEQLRSDLDRGIQRAQADVERVKEEADAPVGSRAGDEQIHVPAGSSAENDTTTSRPHTSG